MYNRYVYNRINWLNKSESLTTPVGKTNLNRMDSAVYNIAENLDVAYNEMSTGKLDKADADKLIVGMPTWNSDTGILTIHFYDNTTFQIDFNAEKIPVSFSMDSAGVITMTTADGTEWTADIGDVIPAYTFADTDTISIEDAKNGDYAHTVKADLKPGSIKEKHLQPNYLADIKNESSAAKASAKSAIDSADNADYDAKLAQSYAVGISGIRDGEATDNSKYYKEKSEQAAQEAKEYLANLESVQVTGVKGSSESSYRKGNVNLTSANIGALPSTTKYAASDSVGGAANNLKYFKSTSTSDTGKDSADSNSIGYVSNTGEILNQSDGALYKQVYSASWMHEIYGDYRTGQIAVRGKNNGTLQSWRRVLDHLNFKDYVTKLAIGLGNVDNTADVDKSVKSADYMKITAGNELQIDYAGDKSSIWLNYKPASRISAPTKLTDYNFGNGQGSSDGVVLHASRFAGTADTATNADTVDGKHASDLLNYNNLTNKPTIPTVGNGTVTIKQSGTSKGTFTMNQSGNTTIELTDNNTTYGVVTQSSNGLMSAADKKRLDDGHFASFSATSKGGVSNVSVSLGNSSLSILIGFYSGTAASIAYVINGSLTQIYSNGAGISVSGTTATFARSSTSGTLSLVAWLFS